jgi:hypothetical protein
VHDELVAVVQLAIEITFYDFRVHEGLRSVRRQRQLVHAGKSWTMNSRHLTGHAVDLWPLPLDWDERAFGWQAVAEAMKTAARELSVRVHWGWDLWGKDMPHWQLAT